MILASDIPTVIITLNEDLIGSVVIEIKQLQINPSPPKNCDSNEIQTHGFCVSTAVL